MSIHLIKSIDKLKKHILHLCATVEENLHLSVKSLIDCDADLAEHIIMKDHLVDDMEVEVEEECLKILALHQPVAIDLRFLIALLKINSDLERIGDLAVNIAEQASFLSSVKKINVPFDFQSMADKVKAMLKKSIDSFVNMDTSTAHEVCLADDEVDQINREMYGQVEEEIHKNPDNTPILMRYISVSRYLERIADHATNMAEDVIYMTKGSIVRHKPEKYVANHN